MVLGFGFRGFRVCFMVLGFGFTNLGFRGFMVLGFRG